MPSLEGLLLNNELQILRVIYVYIRDNRNNRRNPHTAYEHGEREWMLLTGSCGCNCVLQECVKRHTAALGIAIQACKSIVKSSVYED